MPLGSIANIVQHTKLRIINQNSRFYPPLHNKCANISDYMRYMAPGYARKSLCIMSSAICVMCATMCCAIYVAPGGA